MHFKIHTTFHPIIPSFLKAGPIMLQHSLRVSQFKTDRPSFKPRVTL